MVKRSVDVDTDYGNQMLAHGGDSLMWRECALELKIAADALLPHYFSALRERGPGREKQRRKFAFCHGYLILAGLAIENAIKGLEIEKQPSIVTKQKVPKILDEGGHGIFNGLRQHLTLDGDEIDVAARLQEFLIWAAKYPVPLTPNRLKTAETNLLRSHISSDPDVIDGIFTKLLKLYPSSASPYAGDLT
jgi:hypothetical protein